MKKIYVYSKSLFHEMDRHLYRVDVDERNYRRKDGGCGVKGCLCGYPLAHVEWGVVGHPDWIVEVEESPSGGIVILVPGYRVWFERGRCKGRQECWPDDVLDRSQTDGSLYEFGELKVPECFRKSFKEGFLAGLQEARRDAIKKRGDGER